MTALTIKRIPGDKVSGISLDEWLGYISKSSLVRPVPPRSGINPFTKRPTLFHAAPGAAFFATPSGQGSIEYKNGTLVVTAPAADAIPIITQIAEALGAVVEPVA